MNSRQVRVVFEGQARIEFEMLECIVSAQRQEGIAASSEQQLLKSIKQKVGIIRSMPDYGDKVLRDQIPKGMEADNLFVVKLTHDWRMLYTLQMDEILVVAFVLNIVNHPTYDKMFGYRKK